MSDKQTEKQTIESIATDGVSTGDCKRMRESRRDGEPYQEIAEEMGVDNVTVLFHVRGRCDCDHEVEPINNYGNTEQSDRPWTEEEVLEELHLRYNLDFKLIASLFECHDETAANWLEIHGIVEKGTTHTSSDSVSRLQQIDVRDGESITDAVERFKSEYSPVDISVPEEEGIGLSPSEKSEFDIDEPESESEL